jgi:hypothetical protein
MVTREEQIMWMKDAAAAAWLLVFMACSFLLASAAQAALLLG